MGGSWTEEVGCDDGVEKFCHIKLKGWRIRAVLAGWFKIN